MARARTIKRVGVIEARPGAIPRSTAGGGRNAAMRSGGAGRSASVSRKTKETAIDLALVVDGGGRYDIQTGVPFLNHMLELFTRPR